VKRKSVKNHPPHPPRMSRSWQDAKFGDHKCRRSSFSGVWWRDRRSGVGTLGLAQGVPVCPKHGVYGLCGGGCVTVATGGPAVGLLRSMYAVKGPRWNVVQVLVPHGSEGTNPRSMRLAFGRAGVEVAIRPPPRADGMFVRAPRLTSADGNRLVAGAGRVDPHSSVLIKKKFSRHRGHPAHELHQMSDPGASLALPRHDPRRPRAGYCPPGTIGHVLTARQ